MKSCPDADASTRKIEWSTSTNLSTASAKLPASSSWAEAARPVGRPLVGRPRRSATIREVRFSPRHFPPSKLLLAVFLPVLPFSSPFPPVFSILFTRCFSTMVHATRHTLLSRLCRAFPATALLPSARVCNRPSFPMLLAGPMAPAPPVVLIPFIACRTLRSYTFCPLLSRGLSLALLLSDDRLLVHLFSRPSYLALPLGFGLHRASFPFSTCPASFTALACPSE